MKMNYRIIDQDRYYRKGVFRHFSEDCKCSVSMTARVDVTELIRISKATGTKFYINFLYLLSRVLNSRDDYRMGWLWETRELICYDRIHPTQYVFHEDTETCTPVYTTYADDYALFYRNALNDVKRAGETREYMLDAANHPNWFDASFIPWLSYDSLNIELPDGYLYFMPIVNWGRYREENGRWMMPVSVRLNHAVADGYLVANVFRLLEKEIRVFCRRDDPRGSEQILPVDATNILQAATVHSISWQESHRAFCTPEFIKKHTPERQQEYLQDKLNGGARIYMLSDEKPVGIVSVKGSLIEDLYVLPEMQNRGYGTRLLQFAVSLCADTPVLWILENNVRAARFYRRMGFTETGRRNAITNELDEIELQLSRPLPEISG